jgi:hypothetical protein
MSYFIFDMDETLAELHSVYYFVASLRINEIFEEEYNVRLPRNIKTKLDAAYNLFVNEVLRQEASNNPLGILRPGILEVMEELYILQKNKKLNHVLIYSNNGHLQSLEFIRDLIHTHLGTTRLIKECVHWDHHMRDEERTTTPGYAQKTWNVIKNIMVNGHCKAPNNLTPSNVFFFDDLDHKDLQRNLGDNYYKVPAYEFKAPFDRIAPIYQASITNAKVDVRFFIPYVIKVFGRNLIQEVNTLNDIVELFKKNTIGTASIEELPPPKDDGIRMMEEAISRLKMRGGKRLKISFVYGTRRKKSHLFRKKRTRRRTPRRKI